MTSDNIRQPAGNNFLPRQFAQGKDEEGFAGREEYSGKDVARPMRAEINSRVSDGRGDNPVKLAPTPVKNRATKRDHGVVIGMTGWKGSAGTGAFGFGRKTDGRFLENAQKLGTGFLELDHAHSLDLLRAGSLDGVLERVDRGIRQGKSDSGAKDKCAPAKTAEDEEGNGRDDEEWGPDIGITNRRHEQIENGIRPLLVN